MIFQDPMTSLNPTFKIGSQITETLRRHLDMNKEAARKRAIELLEEVGIPDAAGRLDDYPHQFSGGMRQRVMIAIALSCNPALLIADEPTTALDVTIQAQILDLLERLREEHEMAMIIITHDMGVVAEAADDVAVMYAGQIVEQAAVLELFENPEHPYTEALLGALPAARGRGHPRGPPDGHPRAPARPGQPARGLPLRGALPVPGAGLVRGRGAGAARDPAGPPRPLRPSDERACGHAPAGDLGMSVPAPVGERREPGRGSPHGRQPREALPGQEGAHLRAHRRLREGRRRRLVLDPRREDARAGGGVGLREVDDGLLHPPAHPAHLRVDPLRRQGAHDD